MKFEVMNLALSQPLIVYQARDNALDVVKGLLIVFMLLTHIDLSGLSPTIALINDGYLRPWKMGLFFVICGILYRHNSDFFSFASWKFNRIIRPTVLMAMFLMSVSRESTGVDLTTFLTTYSFGLPGGSFGPLWFTLTLFTSLVVFNLLVSVSRSSRWKLILGTMIISIIGYWVSPDHFPPNVGWADVGVSEYGLILPFRLSTVHMVLPPLSAGYLLKDYPSYKRVSWALVGVIVSLVMIVFFETQSDINANIYSNYAYCLICAVAMLPVMHMVARTILKVPPVAQAFIVVSKYSLFVLVMHPACFTAMRTMLSYSGVDVQNDTCTSVVFVSGIVLPLIVAATVRSSLALRSILYGDTFKQAAGTRNISLPEFEERS